MGVFNAFVRANGTKDLTLEELDAKTKGDRQLLCMLVIPKYEAISNSVCLMSLS